MFLTKCSLGVFCASPRPVSGEAVPAQDLLHGHDVGRDDGIEVRVGGVLITGTSRGHGGRKKQRLINTGEGLKNRNLPSTSTHSADGGIECYPTPSSSDSYPAPPPESSSDSPSSSEQQRRPHVRQSPSNAGKHQKHELWFILKLQGIRFKAGNSYLTKSVCNGYILSPLPLVKD